MRNAHIPFNATRFKPLRQIPELTIQATTDRSILKDPDFRSVWGVGIFVGIVRWLEFLAFGIYAFEVTGSPFLVALLALLRFLPLVLFGVFIGALSDIASARDLKCVGLALAGAVSLGMAALFQFGTATYWHVAVATFLSGTLWASDFPLRRKLIGDIAGMGRLARAMAVDTATSNGTRMLGPLMGGLIYQTAGPVGIFIIGAMLYALSLFLMLLVTKAPAAGRSLGSSWLAKPLRDAWAALLYSVRDREIRNILGVTIIFNIWGFPMLSMIPVLGKDNLEISAASIGAITSLEGSGAFIGALLVARFIKPSQFRGCYYYSTCAYLAVVLVLGLLPSIPLLIGCLIAAGLAGAGFATMQSTLIYQVAPDDMRGRLFGLITICIGSGLIGFANLGLLAEFFGTANALWIMALQGIVPIVLVGFNWPQLHERETR